MQNRTLLGLGGALLLIIAIVALLGGATFFTKDSLTGKTAGIYCSSNGTFTDKMPIQSHRSYCIRSEVKDQKYEANTPSQYSFSIVTDEGKVWKDFTITHTKEMHVIVVRKDLANFQHVHPTFNTETGLFTVNDLTFGAEGEYRIFADFAPEGGMMDSGGMPLAVTISEDIKVGDDYDREQLGSEENKKSFGGIEFTLTPTPIPLMAGQETMLTFNLRRNGQPTTDMEKYLGAFGHSIVLREGSLDFIHVHPVERITPHGTLEFMVAFPQKGEYKIFTQFKRGGEVITTDFVVSVAEGSGEPITSRMDHSMQ